jgi:serine/threonine protein kinase
MANQINYLPALAENEAAVIGNCVTRPQDVVVLPHEEFGGAHHHNETAGGNGSNDDDEDDVDTPQQPQLVVDVMNTSPESSHAYMRIPRQPIILDHHGPGWGVVYFGVIVNKVGDGVYQAPSQSDARLVAIKRWQKSVIGPAVQRGANENPYREILRSQVLGDDVHVLRSIEAMQDEDYLYLIMPYCDVSLSNWIPWNGGVVRENLSAAIYQNILENVRYCHERGVCHRDISPDNCLVLNGRVVFNDLAMSFRIPPSPLVQPLGLFGKLSYLPPEVVTGAPFSASSSDLWSATVILFNLLTGEVAWEMPVRANVIYNYLVLAGGVANPQLNERLMERFETHAMHNPMAGMPRGTRAVSGQVRLARLHRIAQRCMGLSDEVKNLLSQILREEFNQTDLTPIRLSTEEAMDHPWMRMHGHGVR